MPSGVLCGIFSSTVYIVYLCPRKYGTSFSREECRKHGQYFKLIILFQQRDPFKDFLSYVYVYVCAPVCVSAYQLSVHTFLHCPCPIGPKTNYDHIWVEDSILKSKMYRGKKPWRHRFTKALIGVTSIEGCGPLGIQKSIRMLCYEWY